VLDFRQACPDTLDKLALPEILTTMNANLDKQLDTDVQ
jgi:hypothetical protein